MLLREVIYGNGDKQSQKASMKLWRGWHQILFEEEVAGWKSTITGERSLVSNFTVDTEIKIQGTMMEFAAEAGKYIEQSRLRF